MTAVAVQDLNEAGIIRQTPTLVERERELKLEYLSLARIDGERTKYRVYVEYNRGRKGYFAGLTASQITAEGFERFTINFELSKDNGMLQRRIETAPRYAAKTLARYGQTLEKVADSLVLMWSNEQFRACTHALEAAFDLPLSLPRVS